MKRLYSILPYLLLAALLCGCSRTPGNNPAAADGSSISDADLTPCDRQFFAMTTVMSLRGYGPDAEAVLEKAEQEVKALDEQLSPGNPSGEVAGLNASGGGQLSEDTKALTDAALKIYAETDGAFDITIGPLMELWGFTSLYEEEAETIHEIPDEARIRKTLQLVDASKLSFDAAAGTLSMPEGMQIDFGGIAKGYASQKLSELFRSEGLTGGVIDLGGNVQVVGTKPDGSPWKVGITDPSESSSLLGVLSVSKDCAVVTTGGYERYLTGPDGKTYHHVLDPSTGRPADNGLLSATIVCEDGTTADGLSTALFVLGTDKAIAFWEEHRNAIDVILVDTDQTVYVSSGIAEQFTDCSYKVVVLK